jgi:hypothetical protein
MAKSKFNVLAAVSAAAVLFSTAYASNALALSKEITYNEFKNIDTKKCAGVKILGKKVEKCINPGKMGGGVNGAASVVTFANADTGEMGAVLMAEQNFVVELFGQKVTIGAVCSFSSGVKTAFEMFLGYSLSTPPIPSVNVSDILLAAAKRGMKSAAKSKPPIADKPATTQANGKKVTSGHAGNVTAGEFKQLLSAAAAGCAPVFPDRKVFSGIKSVELFKAGVSFTMGATNWELNPNTGAAAVTIEAAVEPVAKIGGENFKACVKVVKKKCETIKVPGYSIKKKITMMSKKMSI